MFLRSCIQEMCAEKGNIKTQCKFNFGHECMLPYSRDAQSFQDKGPKKWKRIMLRAKAAREC